MSGPLPAYLAPLTIPASWMYSAVMAARNARFDRGIGVEAIDLPVISVGNLTTGGTGKTPMVTWIASHLLEVDCMPVIAMRGYRARPDTLSDEQAEYARRLPDVHVVAHPDRVNALRAFLPLHGHIRCVILDDGFQHRQIKRDLDLVLIDGTSNALSDRLLPAGNLREPLTSLRRADAVVVTHAPNDDASISRLTQHILRYHQRAPIAWTRHRWTELHIFRSPGPSPGTSTPVQVEPDVQPVHWLRGRRVLTMLGVGKPVSIIEQLAVEGAIVAANVPCCDHEHYDRAKLAAVRPLCQGCDALVVTGKDWVKLEKLIDWRDWPTPIVVPQLAIDVIQGERELRTMVLSAARSGARESSVLQLP